MGKKARKDAKRAEIERKVAKARAVQVEEDAQDDAILDEMNLSAAERQRMQTALRRARIEAKPLTGWKRLTDGQGNVYVGDCVDGKQHGRGFVECADGSKYRGEWRNGKRHGMGTFTYSSGAIYKGFWKEGKRHGRGCILFTDGERYASQWRDGVEMSMWQRWGRRWAVSAAFMGLVLWGVVKFGPHSGGMGKVMLPFLSGRGEGSL
jgi:hypothetical protein